MNNYILDGVDEVDGSIDYSHGLYSGGKKTLVEAENGEVEMFYDKRGVPRTRSEMDWSIRNNYVIKTFRGNIVPTVSKLLDYVDVKLDWYIPSTEALNIINFIRICQGREPENLNSKAHYFFIDAMIGSNEIKPYYDVRGIDFDLIKKHVLILSTREFSKSVLVSYFILYMAYTGQKPGFGKVNFGLYVSDNMKGNVRLTMRTLAGWVKKSPFLMDAFEETKFTDEYIRLIRKPRTKREVNAFNKAMKDGKKIDEVLYRGDRTFTLKGIGASGGRGSRDEDEMRPQFAIFDDMIANEKDAMSKAITEQIEATIDADVGGSLHASNSFKIFIGTAYTATDPIYSRANSGTILPVVFPRAEVAPHSGLYDKDGNLIEPAPTKNNFISVWEDRIPFDIQKPVYMIEELASKSGSMSGIRRINQEFYVRITSETERLIPSALIRWENIEYIWSNAKHFNWYVTTDYTSTENDDSNNSAEFLWAVDWEENYYLMHMTLRKKSIEKQYDDTIRSARKPIDLGAYISEVGIEIDGQQGVHLYGIKKRAESTKNDMFLYFAKQINIQGDATNYDGIRSHGSGDKLWRLKLFSPNFDKRKVIFNESLRYTSDMDTLMEEIELVTFSEIKSKTDDGLDAISQLSLMKIIIPPIPTEEVRYNTRVSKPTPAGVLINDLHSDSYGEEYGDYDIEY